MKTTKGHRDALRKKLMKERRNLIAIDLIDDIDTLSARVSELEQILELEKGRREMALDRIKYIRHSVVLADDGYTKGYFMAVSRIEAALGISEAALTKSDKSPNLEP